MNGEFSETLCPLCAPNRIHKLVCRSPKYWNCDSSNPHRFQEVDIYSMDSGERTGKCVLTRIPIAPAPDSCFSPGLAPETGESKTLLESVSPIEVSNLKAVGLPCPICRIEKCEGLLEFSASNSELSCESVPGHVFFESRLSSWPTRERSASELQLIVLFNKCGRTKDWRCFILDEPFFHEVGRKRRGKRPGNLGDGKIETDFGPGNLDGREPTDDWGR